MALNLILFIHDFQASSSSSSPSYSLALCCSFQFYFCSANFLNYTLSFGLLHSTTQKVFNIILVNLNFSDGPYLHKWQQQMNNLLCLREFSPFNLNFTFNILSLWFVLLATNTLEESCNENEKKRRLVVGVHLYARKYCLYSKISDIRLGFSRKLMR